MKREKTDSLMKKDQNFDPSVMHNCSNCGNRNTGRYCSECGQSFETFNKPFREVIADLAGIFSLDAGIFRTIKPFLFKPGFLAREFLCGRRKKYLSPVRLYIFLSIIFFFILGYTGNRKESNSGLFDFKMITDSTLIEINDSTALSILNNDSLFYGHDVKDSLKNSDIEQVRNSMKRTAENRNNFVSNLMKYASYAMYILMPLFALLLQLVYIRRRRYYIEHLVFSVNMHSFAMLVLTLIFIFQFWFPVAENYIGLGILIMPIYFISGMKRFYRQSVWKIILKVIIVGILYIILLIFVLTGIAWLSYKML